MRVRSEHPVAPLLPLLLLALPLLTSSALCAGQASVSDASAAQTTLVIFADHAMPDALWPALVEALREELDSGSPETRVLLASGEGVDQQVRIIRGDMIGGVGLIGGKSITVVLHGECTTTPRPRSIVVDETLTLAIGELGWVRSSHGHIGPFAHVECSSIGMILSTEAFGLNHDGRIRLMAGAIARVILHEWIHVVTQSSHHAAHGLAKAQFGVADLVAHPTVQRSVSLHDERLDPGTSSFDSTIWNLLPTPKTTFP